MREIKIGSIYRHFKNRYYIVLDIVNDCESGDDGEYGKIVIYKALYGDFFTWARDYEVFASYVDRDKYPNVEQKYRFEEVIIESDKLRLIQKCMQEHNDLILLGVKDLSSYIDSYSNLISS